MIQETYYLLLDAFDKLGAHLFGHTWTGNEIFEKPLKLPEEIQDMRNPFEKEISKIDAKIPNLQKKSSVVLADDLLSKLNRQIEALLAKRSECYAKLSELPEIDQSYKYRSTAYRRKLKTESYLFNALDRGEIQVQIFGGLVLPRELWKGTRGFKCYLDLSLAVMPRNLSGKRRGLIIIPKDVFEKWLKSIRPEVIDDETPLSPFDLCVIYLHEQVKKGPKAQSKSSYLQEAQNLIPDLAERQFKRAWDDVVPDSWKLGGRPSRNKPKRT